MLGVTPHPFSAQRWVAPSLTPTVQWGGCASTRGWRVQRRAFEPRPSREQQRSTGHSGAMAARNEPEAEGRATLTRVDVDEDVVQRCKEGDRAAFVTLFRKHRLDVARLIHRMLGPSIEVEDLVQEVFLQVHRSVAAFRGTSRFSTWLYRVTVNVVLMHRRAQRSRPSLSQDSEAPPAIAGRPLPDDLVARDARIRAFYRVLDRLSEKKRTVFILHEIEGVLPAEIATLVGAPVLTVRTRLFYARREVIDLLSEEPELRARSSELEARS